MTFLSFLASPNTKPRIAVLLQSVFILLITYIANCPAAHCAETEGSNKTNETKDDSYQLQNELSISELDFLKHAEAITLYSTHYGPAAFDQPSVDGFPVKDKTPISSPVLRSILIEGLREAVDHCDLSSLCFEPAFAIQAKSGNETHDFIVCFMCFETIEYIHNGENVRKIHYHTRGDFWTVFSGVMSTQNPSIQPDQWSQSLAAKRTIKAGEEISENDVKECWKTVKPLTKQQTKEVSEKSGDADLTSIDFDKGPRCVQTIEVDQPIQASRIKYSK